MTNCQMVRIFSLCLKRRRENAIGLGVNVSESQPNPQLRTKQLKVGVRYSLQIPISPAYVKVKKYRSKLLFPSLPRPVAHCSDWWAKQALILFSPEGTKVETSVLLPRRTVSPRFGVGLLHENDMVTISTLSHHPPYYGWTRTWCQFGDTP